MKRIFLPVSLLTLCAAAQAQSVINVVNASFEADAIAGANAPVYEIRSTAPTGWTYLPAGGVMGVLAPNANDPSNNGLYNNATAGFDGEKTSFLYQGGALRQTLGVTLQANTSYTVSVASGTRNAGGGTFGGYGIALDTVSGAAVGSWSGVTRNLAAAGSFADTTRTFTTGSNPVGLGESLRITLSQAAAGASRWTDLDNVRITFTPVAARAAATPIDVFFVAGQSNTQGWQANRASLSAANRHYADAPDERALLSYRQRHLNDTADSVGSIGRLGTQGSGFASGFDGFGPELSAGSDLAAGLGHEVAMVKYAIAGAGLEQNFRKTAPTGAALYGAMLAQFNTALQQLRDQGYDPQIKGLFWLQGETDAIAGGATAASYGANITQLIADLRADLNAPELKVFLTEINGKMSGLGGAVANGTNLVNTGMQSADAVDPNTFFVGTSDISSGFADNLHYSADQTITVGQRWSSAYITAVPEPSTYGLIGAGALVGAAFVRRRRRHAGKVVA